ncbi:MAG: D-2-hydroxyacid dehydrogenase [Acetobacteraceae bacterium]|nr:D-2-hydroxyacid dehydrogenase [Acetobacteraceae bacterium]
MQLLLWNDDNGPYRAALEAAGVAGRFTLVECRRAETPDAATLAATDALLAWDVPAGTLARMPKLRWLQSFTAGVEHWLGRPDLPPGLVLTCARGTHRVQMPENILGALFHITKPYHAAALDQREAKWTRRTSRTLAGATLGILGLGAIGQELARKAAALEMRVIGTRRRPEPMPHVDAVFPPEETDEVLARADHVVLLLPSTPGTDNLMDAARLSRMQRHAWLINFGRGGAIVDADLVAALRAGTIAGAVLDVFREEPLPRDHPFWTAPNLVVLPHIGGLHPRRNDVVAALFADNAKRFLAGMPLREAVDRTAGY